MFLELLKKKVKTPLKKVLPKKQLVDEKPLRDELFSIEQFKLHAKKLAGLHRVRYKRGHEKLLDRLKKNEAVIAQIHELLNETGKPTRRISPASEWLLDNFYLIQEQIQLAQKYLPKGYSRELPTLTRGPLAGYPRVYDLAMEVVSHGDGRLDIKGLSEFVGSYQTVSSLKLGELWAIPIMLRLALIENLRRVSSRLILSQIDRDKADYWANRILEVSAKDTNGVILEIAAMAETGIPLSNAFVSEFTRRLHGQSSVLNLPLTWLEKKLAEQGETIERIVNATSQKQAADQVSIANTIESLRMLEAADWHDFVEELSVVEKILSRDPSGDYPHMSFATRDNYRHAIEKLAGRSGLKEEETALKAVEAAQQAKMSQGEHRVRAHVGYYLIDKGLEEFHRMLGINLPLHEYLQAKKTSLSLSLYIGSICFITLAVTAFILRWLWISGIEQLPLLTPLGILLLITTSQTAVALVNWLCTIMVGPAKLPKMDFSEGIPAYAHTLVAVPSMLTGKQAVSSLIENIEVCYLANMDAQVDFALLTDFCDADNETLDSDAALIAEVQQGIEKLNYKYRRHKEHLFYLFHRPRKWNPREKIWMGYERKRGKLSDLNALLRGKGNDRFSIIVGDIENLQDVQYVITLDMDTRMPRNIARDLAGVIAHPLNRPVYDEQKHRVTAGYGIIQPRLEVNYPGNNPTVFFKVYGGETGIDPYTKAVSDVYQDLFFEGSFVGKGLYAVDAFEESMEGRFPENLVLSHDLLEGCYARSALVSDAQLYEDYPSGYLQDVSRRHRWMRGDWQIAGWLSPAVKNPISLLSKWKIFDNVRRSLVNIATASLFLLGWFFLKSLWIWPIMLVLLLGFPILLMSLVEIFRKPGERTINPHITTVCRSFFIHCAQLCFSIAFILYEAYFSAHAILTTLWRMIISRRHLLEWRASGEAGLKTPKSLLGCYKEMCIAPLAGTVLLLSAGLGWIHPDAFSLVIVASWLFAPALAYRISKPPAARKTELSGEEHLFLTKLARKIWYFFETFVTGGDNFLPPDNFQEDPLGLVAHRSSPTNIGLSLLCNLAAYDFGYVSMGMMFNRTEKTINTLNNLEKYRGHFYNWYDTQTLKPLPPLYVSTVDSGNLVGHLLVLRAGLQGMAGQKIVSPKIFDGLNDTLHIISEHIKDFEKNKTQESAGRLKKIQERISYLRETINTRPSYLSEIYTHIRQFLTEISKLLPAFEHAHLERAKKWAKAFERQCYDYVNDMSYIAPWILLPPEIPGMWDSGDEQQKQRLSRLSEELRNLDEIPVLGRVARLEQRLISLIDGVIKNSVVSDDDSKRSKEWFVMLKDAVQEAGNRSSERIKAIDYIVLRCNELSNIEYEFLYNKSSRLLSIGYNVHERKLDSSCYDLLASEARLCSFVAIAQGRMPQDHWFMLGRLISKSGGDSVLISWGGSMFEYLMPLLVMPTYENTLLDRTYKAHINHQITYAAKNNIPWGISESGYNKLDANMTYQYHSFGVPDSGFKRGLSEDLVVAPYASVLALMAEPEKACKNLIGLAADGFMGSFGFYESIDYTPSRLAPGETRAIVKSYMAHHQGMSFLSLAYLLLDKPMQKRFLSDPIFKATELLLQERVPKTQPLLYDIEVTGMLRKTEEKETLLRVFADPNTPSPEIHMLSNGRYHVMVTNSGGGYSRYRDIDVTRWREDPVLDNHGNFIYLRDVETGQFWSTAFQPARKKPKNYEAIFSQSWVEFKRRDYQIETHTKIAVSPEDNIELRRVILTNRSRNKRIIEITSYAEVVLNRAVDDIAHRCFSNLFVQTEIIRSHQAIIARRRPRSDKDTFPLLLHLMAVHGNTVTGASYETDRGTFIGRCGNLSDPAALRDHDKLTDSEGSVIDPIVAIRSRMALESDESATIDYVTGICDTKESAHALMEKYRDRNLADRVFDLAWTHGQVGLQQINATEADAQLYGRLASAIVYPHQAWRANPSILRKNIRGQNDLWGYSISGDLPIVLVRIEDQENIELIARMVQAHSYWRMKGLKVDLVIWNEDSSIYRDIMSDKINGLISVYAELKSNQPGGIFLRRADQMSEEDRILMQTVARIIISDKAGSLSEQLEYIKYPKQNTEPFVPTKYSAREVSTMQTGMRSDLVYFNGFGGFTADGREYVMITSRSRYTPAPWVNVLANSNFGTVISESGGAYTWSENAHEFRLTPWKNDAITDDCGEALYIRDEETGKFWSPTPLPAGGANDYVSRHGFGYSVFEHVENGIWSELTVFVSLEYPVKFSMLKLKNVSGQKRLLSVMSYYEVVMGTFRDKYHMHIFTDVDPKSGALMAYNPYNKEFPKRVVFLDTSETTRFISGDRSDFVGRNGSAASPTVMEKEKLSGAAGAGFDPCVSMQVPCEVDEGCEKEVLFIFGSGKNADEARDIIRKVNGIEAARQELGKIWDYWKKTLGVVYVETPDKSINFLVNGWLQYQTISCRIMARSGFYQSGGAYGFRDQLQDAASLIHSKPDMLRDMLLTFAGRQFIEGDVQHWWHSLHGKGARSRCSDDYLWLPFVTCMYVEAIGDTGVLDEQVGFLEGPLLKPEEESYYDMPHRSAASATLYEHCVLSVKRGLRFGSHGLPLMGSGDWNDGMNMVGSQGKGESVWLAFFLLHILKSMSALAFTKDDKNFSQICIKEADTLSKNIEANAWDGQWYLRAYFDNGDALGSGTNSECSIDSLPQSWAVISRTAVQGRARTAMEHVYKRLVDKKHSLIKLFEPPFDVSSHNPGYIKGYLPGIRENGGQYTHAAIWTVIAFVILKDRARAWELMHFINPVMHANSYEKCLVYKAEPYITAGDVYAVEPNAGRGGWTWYTGSASWMYQLLVTYLLGIRIKVDRLYFETFLPLDWKTFKIHYRYRETFYHITIEKTGVSDDVLSVVVDGTAQDDNAIHLTDDRAPHTAEIKIG